MAPAPYHHGPEIPSLYATALDCNCTPRVSDWSTAYSQLAMEVLTSVAAQVHADTMPDAIRPGFTLLDALLNSSEFLGEKPVYRDWIAVRPTMNALKNRPMPIGCAQGCSCGTRSRVVHTDD